MGHTSSAWWKWVDYVVVLSHNTRSCNTFILNPFVHMLDDNNACIVFTRLTQYVDRYAAAHSQQCNIACSFRSIFIQPRQGGRTKPTVLGPVSISYHPSHPKIPFSLSSLFLSPFPTPSGSGRQVQLRCLGAASASTPQSMSDLRFGEEGPNKEGFLSLSSTPIHRLLSFLPFPSPIHFLPFLSLLFRALPSRRGVNAAVKSGERVTVAFLWYFELRKRVWWQPITPNQLGILEGGRQEGAVAHPGNKNIFGIFWAKEMCLVATILVLFVGIKQQCLSES